MPETIKQRQAKGLYTKKELASIKAGTPAAKKARNAKIMKNETAKQKKGSMYKGKGSDIAITTTPAKKKAAAKKTSTRKMTVSNGVSTTTKGTTSGYKKASTPSGAMAAKKTTTATTATKKSNRATRKTDKLRSKGQEALASGNLKKAKRLSDRSRRTAKRAIKSRK
jgi:hypothetical protein